VADVLQAITALEQAREFVKSRHEPEHGPSCSCLHAHDSINKGIAALQRLADTEQMCWALRQFVKMVPAGADCRLQLNVGAQSFFIGIEPMPEDEAAHFAGLFVFALAGMVQQVAAGAASTRKSQEWTDPEKEPRFQPGEET
jgi:hypothetical protein